MNALKALATITITTALVAATFGPASTPPVAAVTGVAWGMWISHLIDRHTDSTDFEAI